MAVVIDRPLDAVGYVSDSPRGSFTLLDAATFIYESSDENIKKKKNRKYKKKWKHSYVNKRQSTSKAPSYTAHDIAVEIMCKLFPMVDIPYMLNSELLERRSRSSTCDVFHMDDEVVSTDYGKISEVLVDLLGVKEPYNGTICVEKYITVDFIEKCISKLFQSSSDCVASPVLDLLMAILNSQIFDVKHFFLKFHDCCYEIGIEKSFELIKTHPKQTPDNISNIMDFMNCFFSSYNDDLSDIVLDQIQLILKYLFRLSCHGSMEMKNQYAELLFAVFKFLPSFCLDVLFSLFTKDWNRKAPFGVHITGLLLCKKIFEEQEWFDEILNDSELAAAIFRKVCNNISNLHFEIAKLSIDICDVWPIGETKRYVTDLYVKKISSELHKTSKSHWNSTIKENADQKFDFLIDFF